MLNPHCVRCMRSSAQLTPNPVVKSSYLLYFIRKKVTPALVGPEARNSRRSSGANKSLQSCISYKNNNNKNNNKNNNNLWPNTLTRIATRHVSFLPKGLPRIRGKDSLLAPPFFRLGVSPPAPSPQSASPPWRTSRLDLCHQFGVRVRSLLL